MHIIVIGSGKLGSCLAKELADDGHNICVVDHDSDKLDRLGSGFNGQRLRGIEYDNDILIEAGINHADALVALTSDDNINITVSLIAKRLYQVPNIIARVNDPARKFIYDQLDIQTINPLHQEAKLLKSKLTFTSLDVISMEESDVVLIELLVNKENTLTVEEITRKFSCIIAGIIRNDYLTIPMATEVIKPNDWIICTIGKKDKLKLMHALTREVLS